MHQDTKFIGFDVHKETIAVAVAPGEGGEVRSLGTIRNTPDDLAQVIRRLGDPATLACCYEAGPCGYTVYRQLQRLGVACQVVAPSLIPRKPGDRIKTDRRDATKLARLLRSGDLTAVWVPDPAHEALREVTRARERAQAAHTQARQALRMFLLRQGCEPPGQVNAWTKPYGTWLRQLRFPQPENQLVFEEQRTEVDEAAARVTRLEQAIADAARRSVHAPVIAALTTLRGVATLTAATLVAELGDLTRFTGPRQLMAYAGLVPSEASSGNRIRRGGITKTGNGHLRRIAIEAAHHSRHVPQVGRALKQRQAGQASSSCAISWKAQQRLHRRFQRLLARGKLPQQAVVAVARELLGFVWAIADEVGRANAEPVAA